MASIVPTISSNLENHVQQLGGEVSLSNSALQQPTITAPTTPTEPKRKKVTYALPLSIKPRESIGPSPLFLNISFEQYIQTRFAAQVNASSSATQALNELPLSTNNQAPQQPQSVSSEITSTMAVIPTALPITSSSLMSRLDQLAKDTFRKLKGEKRKERGEDLPKEESTKSSSKKQKEPPRSSRQLFKI
jgi:hypothetical protein